MSVSRSEAFDMFAKWDEDRSLVRCKVINSKFTVCFSARIVRLTKRRVMFFSDDEQNQLILPLTDELTYGYGDSRHYPADRAKYESVLVVFFAQPQAFGTPDMIVFLEFVDPQATHF